MTTFYALLIFFSELFTIVNLFLLPSIDYSHIETCLLNTIKLNIEGVTSHSHNTKSSIFIFMSAMN